MLKVERNCVNCGKKFYVENRGEDIQNEHILCPECIHSLSKDNRLKLYEKRRTDKTQIERVCLGCNSIFIIKKPKKGAKRQRLFCDKCVEKLSIYQRKKIKMEKDPSYREYVLENKRKDHKKHIVHNIWKRAKDRAAKYGYAFDIEESDIVIPEKCPLLNIPIFCGDRDNYENSPSLDRIDNSKGYIKGNIWVISKKANSMKNSASFSELNTFCQNIKRYSLTSKE